MTDLTAYHRERRAAVESLNRQMLGVGVGGTRTRRFRIAAKVALMLCAAVVGAALALVAPT